LVDEEVAIEVSVLLTSDKEISRYNAEYRNKDTATNVLSFPLMNQPIASKEPYLCLGDLILALETIEREAIGEGKSFDDHFTHLFVHGMLHLLGFTHDKTVDTSKMQKVEIDILRAFGVKSPYRLDLK
jgi:probable rRNA maturation factor